MQNISRNETEQATGAINIRRAVQIGEMVDFAQKDLEIIEELDLSDSTELTVKALNGRFKAKVSLHNGRPALQIIGAVNIAKSPPIHLIQSLPEPMQRINRTIEVAIELGVSQITPVISYYNNRQIDQKKFNRDLREVKKKAGEQSLSSSITEISECTRLSKINLHSYADFNKICLSTEPIERVSLSLALDKSKPHLIAIGPPRGWHSSEIERFAKAGFKFVELKGGILRTDSAGIALSVIIKYIQGAF